jgi:hypothetical protein
VSEVQVNGNFAYVVEYFDYYPDSRLTVYDISNPSNPTQLDSIHFWGIIEAVEIRQNIAFVGGSLSDLILIDISNPTHLSVVGSITYDWEFRDMEISDSLLFMADYRGIHVYNVNNSASPQIIGSAPAFNSVKDVFVRGNYAYVASVLSLYVVDISNPFRPMITGGVNVGGNGREIYVSGDSAFIASWLGGIYVVNIANPSNPYVVTHWSAPPPTRGICINGHYAYVTGSLMCLGIIDLTGMSDPTDFATSGPAWNIEVVGDYGYIADAGYLTIINVADPTDPSTASVTNLTGAAYDLCVEGDYVYIAALSGGLQIYNITNPYSPIFVGSYSDGNEINGVKILDHYAMATTTDSELVAIDIIDPASPILVSRYTKLLYGQDLFVSDDIIFTTDERSLQLFRLIPAGIHGQNFEFPDNLMLLSNYPNPFNSSTTFKYALSKPAQVNIDIYDMLGRQVHTINSQIQPAGNHELIWNAEDMASGLYFYRIQAGSYSQTRKCLLLK